MCVAAIDSQPEFEDDDDWFLGCKMVGGVRVCTVISYQLSAGDSDESAGDPLPPSLDCLTGSGVISGLNDAWANSNPNAPEVPRGQPGSTKHEEGGFVLVHDVTGVCSITRVPAGERDHLDPWDLYAARPGPFSDTSCVYWFHTHPNKLSEGYAPGFSKTGDYPMTLKLLCDGLLLTHDGQTVSGITAKVRFLDWQTLHQSK